MSQRDYFGYLAPGASILRGRVGSIKLNLENRVGTESFAHTPNYIGDNQADATVTSGVTYTLNAPAGSYIISLRSIGSAFGEKPVSICVDSQCQVFSKEQELYSFTVINPTTVSIQSDNDVAYVVLSDLTWKRN